MFSILKRLFSRKPDPVALRHSYPPQKPWTATTTPLAPRDTPYPSINFRQHKPVDYAQSGGSDS